MNLQPGTFNFLLIKKREREREVRKIKQNQVLIPDP